MSNWSEDGCLRVKGTSSQQARCRGGDCTPQDNESPIRIAVTPSSNSCRNKGTFYNFSWWGAPEGGNNLKCTRGWVTPECENDGHCWNHCEHVCAAPPPEEEEEEEVEEEDYDDYTPTPSSSTPAPAQNPSHAGEHGGGYGGGGYGGTNDQDSESDDDEDQLIMIGGGLLVMMMIMIIVKK